MFPDQNCKILKISKRVVKLGILSSTIHWNLSRMQQDYVFSRHNDYLVEAKYLTLQRMLAYLLIILHVL